MRFNLNFVAVVRNVTVMVNVAILAVVRFVVVHQPVHHSMVSHRTTHGTEKMRGLLRLLSSRSFSDLCDPCKSSSTNRSAEMGLAYAVISTEREITSRRQQERLLSKRRRDDSLSTASYRG